MIAARATAFIQGRAPAGAVTVEFEGRPADPGAMLLQATPHARVFYRKDLPGPGDETWHRLYTCPVGELDAHGEIAFGLHAVTSDLRRLLALCGNAVASRLACRIVPRGPEERDGGR